MITVPGIKNRIQKLYEVHPNIHIHVRISNPKVHLTNAPAAIIGVYPHIFQIEEYSSGTPKRHSIQYSDVLIGQVEIVELCRENQA